MEPRRHGAGLTGATAPHSPRDFRGSVIYLYKKPLAPGARIKLCWTRADCRVVIAMSVPHHYPCSCRATRPQGRWGGSPSGEGALGPLEESFQGVGVSKGEREIEIPLPLACFWLLFARAKSDPGSGAGEAPSAPGAWGGQPHRVGHEQSLVPNLKKIIDKR